LRLLQEAETLKNSGDPGALLRREDLSPSNIAMWNWQREKGELKGLTPKKRGPKEKSPEELENGQEKSVIEERKKDIYVIIINGPAFFYVQTTDLVEITY